MKKLLLTLGTTVAIASPIATVACFSDEAYVRSDVRNERLYLGNTYVRIHENESDIYLESETLAKEIIDRLSESELEEAKDVVGGFDIIDKDFEESARATSEYFDTVLSSIDQSGTVFENTTLKEYFDYPGETDLGDDFPEVPDDITLTPQGIGIMHLLKEMRYDLEVYLANNVHNYHAYSIMDEITFTSKYYETDDIEFGTDDPENDGGFEVGVIDKINHALQGTSYTFLSADYIPQRNAILFDLYSPYNDSYNSELTVDTPKENITFSGPSSKLGSFEISEDGTKIILNDFAAPGSNYNSSSNTREDGYNDMGEEISDLINRDPLIESIDFSGYGNSGTQGENIEYVFEDINVRHDNVTTEDNGYFDELGKVFAGGPSNHVPSRYTDAGGGFYNALEVVILKHEGELNN